MVKKVLIVDDEIDTLESIKEVLEKEGFEVEPVTNAKECIKRAKENKHDIILIDIYMPGMSGEKLFKILRKTVNHLTPIAYITIKPRAEVDLTDVDGFIQKPFENRNLVKEIKKVIVNFKTSKKKTQK